MFCIDTFEEHASLLLRIEYELESIREEDLPQRSMFEEFMPYVHLYSKFEELKLELEVKETVSSKMKVKRKLSENESLRKKMKKELESVFNERFNLLLTMAEYITHIEYCNIRPDSACGDCNILLFKAGRAEVPDCQRKLSMFNENFRIALRAAVQSSGL